MANVKLAASIWVDLYDATGIAVGTRIQVTNITPNDVRVASTAGEPTGTTDHIPVLFRGGCNSNAEGDAGAWALCVGGGAIDVQQFQA